MLAVVMLLAGAGCHSAFVQTSVTNLGPPIHTLEIDYPSQSFGVQQLASNGVFHYRFKVQGSGPLKVQFFDPAGKQHNATGPLLEEQDEGSLVILLTADSRVEFHPALAKVQ